MTNIVDFLNRKLSKYLSREIFKVFVSLLIYLNPIALIPQLWTVFTAPSLAGISLTMWGIFLAIQTGVMLEGIRVRSTPMFWSMFISAIFNSTIITTVLIRS